MGAGYAMCLSQQIHPNAARRQIHPNAAVLVEAQPQPHPQPQPQSQQYEGEAEARAQANLANIASQVFPPSLTAFCLCFSVSVLPCVLAEARLAPSSEETRSEHVCTHWHACFFSLQHLHMLLLSATPNAASLQHCTVRRCAFFSSPSPPSLAPPSRHRALASVAHLTPLPRLTFVRVCSKGKHNYF